MRPTLHTKKQIIVLGILFKRVLLSLFFMLLVHVSKAAVNTYTFTSSNATYTAITGTTLFSGTWDDAASAMLTLPFSFAYNGTSYTTLAVSTNGFITMGAVPATTYCGLQASALNSIAGYGTDLVNGSTTSTIQYATTGTAPNRQFVVQYTDCKHYGAGTDHYTFQIILNETSNTVQVVWGSTTAVSTMGANTCSDAATESGSVGLLGASTADFAIRSVTNGTNTWTSSVNGGLLSAVCTMSPTNFPATGLTYTWTPPVPLPMVFSSCTTVMLNNGEVNAQGAASNKIIQVQVVTSGNLSPFSVTNLLLSTTGCTIPLTDISNAKVYFTGTSAVFAGAVQFGTTVANPNGSYSMSGNATLSEGANYFWIQYDVNPGAVLGHLISGCCTQITGAGSMGVRVPTVTCPSGSHSVGTPIGFWTPVASAAPSSSGGAMMLLSDGTVMAKSSAGGASAGNLWNKLTPDANGSYINGTWTTLAPMINTRLYFSSQVLKDGRVYVAGGEYGTGLQQAETYDPLTNVWTLAPSPAVNISDANSEILSDGRVLQALVTGALTATTIFNPATNTFTAGPNSLGIHNESAWVKLPDNSILMVDRLSTNSERYIPSLNAWVADATVPVALYDGFGDETGGGVLLPDGRAFFIGSIGHTAYYTPSGTNSPGVWTAGPDIPGAQGVPDGPAAMMVNGKILMDVSPIPTSANHFPSPTAFYEFDYLSNTYTQINTPFGGTTTNISCYVTSFLDLPDGTILYSTQGSSQYYIYTPGSGPLVSGKPVINTIAQTGCSSFSITGTKFNGISQGATYGDDWQMNTNYPVIRLTNGSNVYYCRTFNWNTTGVQRGSLPDTVQFTLPAGLPVATYSLVVTANGIASDPVLFTPTPYLTSTLTPASVCSQNVFAYAPTMAPASASFSWTRAAVAGISNAAVTIPQTSNPNEVLINTTSNPINVGYTFVLTSNGCSNTQSVSVSVKPKPIASITGNTTFCSGGSTTLNAGAGFTGYNWSTGASTQSISVNTAGTYSVTVSNSTGCTSTAAISITQLPSTPTAQSATACNSYSWAVNGLIYTNSGVYSASYTSVNGCDSSFALTLTINHGSTSSSNMTSCNSYIWFGNSYTLSGNYTHTSTNIAGCLQTDTLHLVIHTFITTSAMATACDSYTWFGNSYSASGNYTHTALNGSGCVNADTLHLSIHSNSTSSNAATSCYSYAWFGTNYTLSGLYTHTSMNASGCQQTDTLHLVVNENTVSSSSVTACDTYVWLGNNYTSGGIYTHTSTNVSGCMNTDTLQLIINSSTHSSVAVSSCDAYTWSGNTYTQSGNYTNTGINASGCMNADTLHLTINNSTHTSAAAIVCDSYSWLGNTFTHSGVYTQTFMNANGCLNSDTLYLTINNSVVTNASASSCDTYSWLGTTYTTGGVYTHTSNTASGCLQTDYLQLVINSGNNSAMSITVSGCYTWNVTGATYTSTGVYTVTQLNASGCINTSLLNLTILPGVYLNAKAFLSGPYVIADGLMHDSLRVNNLIPMTEPYTAAPYGKMPIGDAGGESISSQALETTGNDAMVDWVFLELRSAANPSNVVANRRALIQRDGDIVSTDGVSPVYFSTTNAGSYFVCVKHRNHIGIMSYAALNFTGCTVTSIDLTDASPVYTNPAILTAPRKIAGSVYALWSGDANNNKNVKYNGLSNDKDRILLTVGAGNQNNTLSPVYRMEDLNMDGKVKYNSTDNDRVIILDNIGVGTPNNIINQHTPN